MAEENPVKRFRLVGGPHTQPVDPSLPSTKMNQAHHKHDRRSGQHTYVDSILPLDTLFRYKFQFHAEDQKHLHPKAQERGRKQLAKIEQDREDAEIKELGITKEEYESSKVTADEGAADTGDKKPEGAGKIYALGKDVTSDFPKAEGKNILVLEDSEGAFQIVNKDHPDDALNTEGALTKDKATKFIAKLP